MIQSLSINNFALIEKMAIDFSDGFSIITGETGAGKSILLGALGLVLGKRADLTSLKNKEEKCVIEAAFDISNYNLQPFFEANDLDYDAVTILRREILPSGKSRAFINDTPVNLQELQNLSEFLIDVHSQHQTQELSENQYQFAIIDAVASNADLIASFQSILKQYKKDTAARNTLQVELQNALKEQDYNTFLLTELQSVSLKTIDQAALESESEQLSNVEFIKEHMHKAITVAQEDQYGVIYLLNEIRNSLQRVAGFSSEYQTIYDRINSIAIEMDDAVGELEKMSEHLIHDPEKLELVSQKLQLVYTLQKKHQVATVEELIAIQAELEQKVDSISAIEDQIKVLEISLKDAEIQLDQFALKIHENRINAVPALTNQWVEILSQLGMPNVRFKIEITETNHYLTNGKSELQFLFAANLGSDFGLLKKVASGGELSRIMLATKAILANYSKLPTIIFDEIDTGVSGEIANKMGEIMKTMSRNMQVFAITHLPQIAAKGDTHFKVYKSVMAGDTLTELKQLTPEERVVEIAQMLSGTEVSESALNHAKALLN
ncbi:DNA repair protein RecN [Flavobacterium sp.]|uniref:DNA repair protein RecN n=1 Tax=Flavobacterium sp. TaxID=239 RepID=UPI0026030FDD|nr:DNA repair protein RecN [Flavobacterium sp.]